MATGARRTANGTEMVLLVVASLGVGGAMAYFGPIALLGAVGIAGAVLMIRRPFLGVLVLISTLPVENATLFAGGFTTSRLVGIAVAGGWITGKVLRRESFSRVLSAPVAWLSLAFLTLVISSALWADNPFAARSGFIRLVQLAALGIIVLDVVDSWDKVHQLFRVFVCAGIAGAGLTLFESLFSQSRRAGDALAGINGTAELLVTLMPCAFYLIVAEKRLIWRFAGALYIGLASGAVLATLSRWSIMLLPVVILVMTVQTLRAGRGRGWLLAGFAAITVAVFSQEDSFERLERRIQSIVPYLTSTVQSDYGGLSERGYHLAVGIAMFQDYPVLGVGYDNFGDHFLYRYQYIVPGGNNLWTTRRSPHSSHVGMMAELGLMGALLWAGLLATVVWGAWRTTRTWEVRSSRGLSVGAFGLLIALLLQAGPYAMYGPNQKSKLLWILIGLSVAVFRIAKAADEEALETVPEGEWSMGDDDHPRDIGVGALTPVRSGGYR